MNLIEQLKKKTTTIDLKAASAEERKQINNGLVAISSNPTDQTSHEIKLSEQVQKQVVVRAVSRRV